jgi:hypothetical protein
LRKYLLILAASSVTIASAQRMPQPSMDSRKSIAAKDFTKVVVPISKLKVGVHPATPINPLSLPNPPTRLDVGVGSSEGSGFCLDTECRFIGTNYHVARMGIPRKIRGEKVVRTYLATGPEDDGATLNLGPSPAKYTSSHDLAIFELRRPLENYHGIAFSQEDLQTGQEVLIYGYPSDGINPLRRLTEFQGTFKGETNTGLLIFGYSQANGARIRGGASGGIVVDRNTLKIVGILSAIGTTAQLTVLAVPVKELANFVCRANPFLARRIFPNTKAISPVAPDLYPKLTASSVESSHHRQQEAPAISILRTKAQHLGDSIRNFSAVERIEWGSKSADSEPSAIGSYEVQVLDGYQKFREYPNGKKYLTDLPFPALNNALVPGGEWSELPLRVGTELGLKIVQAPDATVNQNRLKVFQYQASVEDGLCTWTDVDDFGLFSRRKEYSVECYGEVWADEAMNILRISEHLNLTGKWKDYHSLVTYSWIKLPDQQAQLVPATISTEARLKNTTHWCRGQFTNYQVFQTEAKIIASSPVPDHP